MRTARSGFGGGLRASTPTSSAAIGCGDGRRGEGSFHDGSSYRSTEFHELGGLAALADSGLGGGLERLPAAAERLVQLHAVEQQLRVAVVGADAHGQARALRIEQRQQIDLPAVVERLRAAERRVGRGGGALQRLRRAAVRRASATSAFSTSSSARTIASS